MRIIKETIKSNSVDVNLTITLDTIKRVLGNQQEIDDFTEETKTDLVNPIIDNEVRRFKTISNDNPKNILFYFTDDGASYLNTFDAARFTSGETVSNDLKILNSFFILDLYDTFNSYTQTKIFTTYLTKISGKYDVDINNHYKPYYRIYPDTSNQLYYWNIPKSFIDKQTGSTVITYVKFSFYNAKYGDMTLFYNKDNQMLKTQEKMYFKVRLNLINMTWEFYYNETLYPPNVTAYQLPFNNSYSKKLNDTIESSDENKQDYPAGTIFDKNTATYVDNIE